VVRVPIDLVGLVGGVEEEVNVLLGDRVSAGLALLGEGVDPDKGIVRVVVDEVIRRADRGRELGLATGVVEGSIERDGIGQPGDRDAGLGHPAEIIAGERIGCAAVGDRDHLPTRVEGGRDRLDDVDLTIGITDAIVPNLGDTEGL